MSGVASVPFSCTSMSATFVFFLNTRYGLQVALVWLSSTPWRAEIPRLLLFLLFLFSWLTIKKTWPAGKFLPLDVCVIYLAAEKSRALSFGPLILSACFKTLSRHSLALTVGFKKLDTVCWDIKNAFFKERAFNVHCCCVSCVCLCY